MARVPEYEINRWAEPIAVRLFSLHTGDRRIPETWQPVADACPHIVRFWHEPGGAVAEYDMAEEATGVIWINTAHSRLQQAHGYVHELGHAELCRLASGLAHGEVPGWLAGEFARAGYDDDPEDVRHRVARRVEQICFQTAKIF